MSRLHDLAQAIVSEGRQRYEMSCLLDRLRKDQRTLDDIGFSYAPLAKEIKREQHERSPLRRAVHQGRKGRTAALRRAAHDLQ